MARTDTEIIIKAEAIIEKLRPFLRNVESKEDSVIFMTILASYVSDFVIKYELKPLFLSILKQRNII